jgi:four helix bundle protein
MICKRERARKDFAFVDQVTRGARSVSANIAEGSDAMTIPEFIQFLGFAKRSAAEVRAHLYDAFDEEYISLKEFDSLCSQTQKIGAMLAKLIHHLQSRNQQYKRTYKQSTNQQINESTNQHS